MEPGITVAYALDNLQDRGTLFLNPVVSVYEGMIIGEHSREKEERRHPSAYRRRITGCSFTQYPKRRRLADHSIKKSFT